MIEIHYFSGLTQILVSCVLRGIHIVKVDENRPIVEDCTFLRLDDFVFGEYSRVFCNKFKPSLLLFM